MGKIIVDEEGRIIIPEEERKALGLEPGALLQLRREGDSIILCKVVSFEIFTSSLRGCITTSEDQLDPLKLKLMK